MPLDWNVKNEPERMEEYLKFKKGYAQEAFVPGAEQLNEKKILRETLRIQQRKESVNRKLNKWRH